MNSKPKIVVLRMREIIYTVLLVLLVILLFSCLFLMFSPGNSNEGGTAESTEQQTAGTGETTTDTDSQSETLPQVTEQSPAGAAGQSGSDQTDASGQSSTTVQSAAVQADTAQSAAAETGTVQSAAVQADTAQSAAAETGTVQSAAVQADTAQSGTDQTSVAVSSPMNFTPGVYTVPVFLNDAAVDVEVTVDSNHINAIRLVNLNETVETMYPLMSPALENITSQILQRQTLDGITCPQENRYTSQVLLNAISDALGIAQSSS